MKVSNLKSSASGKSVANQFHIVDNDGNVYFQSYDSIIVKIERTGQVYLDERYWDYSVTTGRYRNQFLGESKAETAKKINEGQYILADLN